MKRERVFLTQDFWPHPPTSHLDQYIICLDSLTAVCLCSVSSPRASFLAIYFISWGKSYSSTKTHKEELCVCWVYRKGFPPFISYMETGKNRGYNSHGMSWCVWELCQGKSIKEYKSP